MGSFFFSSAAKIPVASLLWMAVVGMYLWGHEPTGVTDRQPPPTTRESRDTSQRRVRGGGSHTPVRQLDLVLLHSPRHRHCGGLRQAAISNWESRQKFGHGSTSRRWQWCSFGIRNTHRCRKRCCQPGSFLEDPWGGGLGGVQLAGRKKVLG